MIPPDDILTTVVRLGVAAFCGIVIGVQRAYVGKAAGVRTHFSVCLGAALITLMSAYTFHSTPPGSIEPRVVAQIVTGIGFLCAGTILHESKSLSSIRGLTTAATLWVMAGIGIAAGAGLFKLALIALLFILGSLIFLGKLDTIRPHTRKRVLELSVPATEQVVTLYSDLLRTNRVIVNTVAFDAGSARPGEANLKFIVNLPQHLELETITAQLLEAGALKVEWDKFEIEDS